jgi:hypothetical protein
MMTKPREVVWATSLLWARFALGLFTTALDWSYERSLQPVSKLVLDGALTFLFLAFLIWKISQGRNWARFVYLVLFLFGGVFYFTFARAAIVRKQLDRAAPALFQEALWKLLDSSAKLTTIAIVSDEPFVLWELMIPQREVGQGLPPDIRDPLRVEFRVGRMTRRSHVAGAQKIPLRGSYVVAPVFDGPRNLPHAQEEADFVTESFPGTRINPANFDSLNAKLNPCPSLLHFACHGQVTGEGKQILYLDNEKEFSAVDLCGLPGPERGIPIAQPLVFLNASRA